MPQVAALPKVGPAGKAAARVSGAKDLGTKPQVASMESHPIPLPAARALPAPSVTPAAKPATPKPAAPATDMSQEQLSAEPSLVWEVSPPTESPADEKKRPRTWTP
jgi:hypothetical protein